MTILYPNPPNLSYQEFLEKKNSSVYIEYEKDCMKIALHKLVEEAVDDILSCTEHTVTGKGMYLNSKTFHGELKIKVAIKIG